MKKVLALALAALLVIGLTVSVYAEDPTYSFTVNQEAEGYTYTIYQIFTGDASTNAAGKAVLSNIEWGNGVKDDSSSLTRLCSTRWMEVTTL